ncbi:zinc finger BED domain-containing protein 5-like [Tiliqua scincoides]|uniref:zinc finger BED domain-containing protein 5-like n=1 Tax=Tiliqua scincoides TaxID=71010 RepID=UPI00346218E0
MDKPLAEQTMTIETDEEEPSVDEDEPSIDEEEPSTDEEEPTTNSKRPKRRKVKRKYDSDYLKLGFTWNGDEDDPRPQCVLCGRLLANESMRPNKLRRHIEAKHPHLQDQPLQFYKTQLKELKASKKKVLPNTKVNEKAMHASYHISLRIAKAGKPHTTGESSVLPVIKDAVGVMFSDKSSKEVETIPLSNSTVARRIDEMSQWVEELLIQRVRDSKFFSLLLDESTDVGGLCQLLVFVRYIWNNQPHEDMLCCQPISQSTSEEIFQTLNSYVQKKGLDWMKCVGICTDGARAMCGKKSSVVTRVLEVCPNASWTHCSIHREVLVSKSMSENLKNVLNTSIKIVNFIKSKSLQPRLFEKLCEEMGSTHTSLFLHTEARWLSRGKVLTRVVELREEIAMLLDDKSDLAKWLRNKEFVLVLSYLADIFSKLNELNLYLQVTEGDDIFAVHDKIRGFIKKLVLWKKNVEDCKYDCFDTFQTFIIENEVYPAYGIIIEIAAHLNALKEDFDYYFSDEMKNCQQKNWILNPFQGYVTTGISTKADEELIDLSKDTSSKLNFNRRKLTQFWLSVQQTFPTLSTEALKVLLPFSSSYTCEVGFSAMVGIKNRFRNKLQLSNSLRLKITNIDVDINAVINSNRKQAHPSHKPHLEKQI